METNSKMLTTKFFSGQVPGLIELFKFCYLVLFEII